MMNDQKFSRKKKEMMSPKDEIDSFHGMSCDRWASRLHEYWWQNTSRRGYGSSFKPTQHFSQQILCLLGFAMCVWRTSHKKRSQMPCSSRKVRWLLRSTETSYDSGELLFTTSRRQIVKASRMLGANGLALYPERFFILLFLSSVYSGFFTQKGILFFRS